MSRINLDDLTLREIREIQALLPPVAAPDAHIDGAEKNP